MRKTCDGDGGGGCFVDCMVDEDVEDDDDIRDFPTVITESFLTIDYDERRDKV